MGYLVFIVGLALGSFYNVVGFRVPKKESIIFPGSNCSKCKHHLSWYENIPLISYLFLKGKCRHCKMSISLIYPIMELLTAILFLVSYYLFGFSADFLIAIVVASLLVLCSI